MAIELPIKHSQPVPIGGLNFSVPETLLDHIYTQDLLNCVIEDGVIKKRLGYAEFGTSFPVAVPIMEMVEYGDGAGALHLVFLTTTGMIETTTGGVFTARTGNVLTATPANAVFAEQAATLGTNYLYITNGVDKIKVWTGTGNYSDLTTTGFTTLKAKALIGANAHLLIGDVNEDGTEYPYRIRWCKVGDMTAWSTGDVSEGYANLVNDKSNSKVMAFEPMRGTIICYKFGSIYSLTYAGDPYYFVPKMIIADRGAISRKGIAPFGDLHLVVTNDNIHVFDGFNFANPPIGDRIKSDFFGELNWDEREKIFCKTFPGRFEVWILYPTGASTVPDKAYCWNYKDNSWTKHDFNDDGYCLGSILEFFTAQKEMYGINGKPHTLFSGNSDDSVDIAAHFRTKLYDFADQGVEDRIKTAFRVEVDSDGTLPTVQMGAVNGLFDTITYSTAQAVVAGGTSIKRASMQKSGRYLTLKVSDTSSAAAFRIAKYKYFAEPKETSR